MKRFASGLIVLGLVVALVFTACAAPKTPGPAPAQAPAAPAPTATPGAPAAPGAASTREQKLIEAAKKEGKVVVWAMSWYPGPVEKAFEAKYPFLKVEVWDGSDAVEPKVIEEYKAGRYTPDVLQLAIRRLQRVHDEGVLGAYEWPNVVGWGGRQPNHNFWRIHQISGRIPMYNTKLVAPADIPQKWEDLNNTKWRGKAIASRSGADFPLHYAWLLGDLTEKGVNLERSVKFWKEVVATTRPVIGSGFKGPLEQLVVGDVSIMLVAAATTGLYNIRAGAPIDFAPFKKVAGGVWGLALPKNPPHPNAARLFLDFLTTEEGALIHANTSPNPTYQPQAAKKAYPNLFFASRGIEVAEVPEELATTEDFVKASDIWIKEILTAK